MQPNTIQNLPKLTPEQLAQNNAELASGKITASPTALTQGYQTISSDNLLPTKAVTIQPTPYNNPAIGLQTSIEQNNKNILTGLQASQDNQKTAYDTSKSDLQSTINNIIGIQQNRSALETSAGIDTKAKALTDITNEIESKQLALRRTIEDLQSKNPQGLSAQGLDTEVNRINREGTRELADLAIIQSARNRDLSTAQTLVDRKIQLQLEPLKTLLDYQKTVLEDNRDLYTKAEQRTYENTIRQNEQKYNAEQDKLKVVENFKLNVLNNMQEQGASTQDLKNVQNQDTVAGIIIASKNKGYKLNSDVVKLDNGNTVIVNKNTGKIINDLGGAKTKDVSISLEGLTPEQANDPFISKLLRTAGGKPLTDTFAQRLDKGLTVLDQIGVLQQNIANVKTGPIVGAFKGANPWDTNAQTIKAQLNAIVPNLARGVYGEVGVLTDNDIATYSKTLPNLNSTEDIRNAVLGITVDLIGKSIKRTLEVNASNGKDVSQFVDLYNEMNNTRDSILSQIPGYKGNVPKNTQQPTNQPIINANNRTVTVGGKTYSFSTTEAFNKAIKEAGYSQ